jgi:uncharacterized membrane protein YhaH (DUF805 family)
MDFQTSVKTCFNKYADFTGRARRSELWWFALFAFVLGLITMAIDAAIGSWGLINAIGSIAVLLPSIAVGVRRLHDRDMSGWFYLIVLIPVIGAIALLVIFCLKGTDGPNRFGTDPLS